MPTTAAQLDAIAKLTRRADGPAMQAVRLVLVDGVGATEAARRCGVLRSTVTTAVASVRDALALARIAAGISESSEEIA